MVKGEPAKKLTICVDEADTIHGKPAYGVLLDIFVRRKTAGAGVFRGMAGYGSEGVFHAAKILELSATLPVNIEVVDFGRDDQRRPARDTSGGNKPFQAADVSGLLQQVWQYRRFHHCQSLCHNQKAVTRPEGSSGTG